MTPSSRSVSSEGLHALRARGASPELIEAAQRGRRRKAKLKLGRPTVPYSVTWEPEVDSVTGQMGHGLLTGLKVWWKVRRGKWEDDEINDWWFTEEEVA